MNSTELFTQFYNEPFASIPKCFFTDEKYKKLSNSAKILYIFLFDRTRLSLQNGWEDADGQIFVYCTLETASEVLNLSKNTCIKVFRELEGVGLVRRKKQHFGQPDMIYVEAFSQYKK